MIEVILNGQGLGHVVVDRKDLTDNVKGLSLEHTAGETPRVVIELAATDAYPITLRDVDAAYGLGEPVRRLLDALDKVVLEGSEADDEVLAAAAALRALLEVPA